MLTVLSLGASLFLLTTLEGLLSHMTRNTIAQGSASRIIVRRKTSLQDLLPEHYAEKVRAMPGIAAVSPMIWFGGIYIDFKPEFMFGQLSCDPGTFREVVPEAKIVDVETGKEIVPTETNDPYRDFMSEQTAAIAGRELFRKYNWKIGQTIVLQGTIYPVDLRLTLRAAYHAESGTDNQTLYYHQKYLDESLGRPGKIGVVSARVQKIDEIPSLITKIDGAFENSDYETLTETEQAFQLGFLKMLGNINSLIRWITSAVAITMLMVAANTTAMAARERAYEIAVMKAIGFSVPRVLLYMVAEATLVGVVGSILGVGLAIACVPAISWMGEQSFMSFFLYGYKLDPVVAAAAFGIGVLVSFLAAIVPCWRVASLPIATMIRRTA